MAYPFPRLVSGPQTPQHPKGIETPPNMSSHVPKSSTGQKRNIALIIIVVLAVSLLLVNPFSTSIKQTDRVPPSHGHVEDYFDHFEGHQDCGVTSKHLYVPPPPHDGHHKSHSYCQNRATLLEAMSGGGRHGFDASFHPSGCHYRWYSTAEVCMILDRFDAVVFIGDDLLKHIYTAFNVLLRENIVMGGLKQWEMQESERDMCRCDNQFIRSECSEHAVLASHEVKEYDGRSGRSSPYYCARTPHLFLPITDSPAPDSHHKTFTSLLTQNPDSYKPIPVIHSLSLATALSWSKATASMDEWIGLADAAMRSVPILWVGPNAAGHLKPPSQILSQGNNALWHFTLEMAKEARAREVEALSMYNLTLQATSWDGTGYGQKVALVQAMMIINWLSRLDST